MKDITRQQVLRDATREFEGKLQIAACIGLSTTTFYRYMALRVLQKSRKSDMPPCG
jgi:hypothetical protein